MNKEDEKKNEKKKEEEGNVIMLPTSLGDGYDRLSILILKLKYITDEKRKEDVTREYKMLLDTLNQYGNSNNRALSFHFQCLLESNEKIWKQCEDIRDLVKTTKEQRMNLCDAIIQENDVRCRIKGKLNHLTRCVLREQKSYKKRTAILLVHNGVGDLITMNGAIRYFATQYDHVIFFDRPINSESGVATWYLDDPNISVDYAPDAEAKIKECYSDKTQYDVFRSGHCWTGNPPNARYEHYFDFYRDLNLPWEYTYKYFYMRREPEKEQALWDRTVGQLGKDEPFIFIHDDVQRAQCYVNFQFLKERRDEICVYHPGRNFYADVPDHKYYHIWQKEEKNVGHFALMLEKALELYMLDSCFFCLANRLELTATKKVVYCRCNVASYLRPGTTWEYGVK